MNEKIVIVAELLSSQFITYHWLQKVKKKSKKWNEKANLLWYKLAKNKRNEITSKSVGKYKRNAIFAGLF